MIALFLRNNWQWLIGAAVSIALGVSLLLVKAQLDATRADLRAEKVLTSGLSDQIEDQNQQIANWKAASEANREVYLEGLAAANRQAVRLEIKAEDYLNMPIPSDPVEACVVAKEILEGVTK